MNRHIPRDYLKYYRVIRHYVCLKYKISYPDLEMLFFLHSEKYFSRKDFDKYNKIFSWEVYKFNRLLREGWIDKFRVHRSGNKAIYKVSQKGLRMLDSFYKKLAGEEIPESACNNPLFLKNISYTDRRYQKMIKEMNEFIRQQRHRAPE